MVDITPDQDGGIIKTVLREAPASEDEGPMTGDTVVVHYVGTLENGEKFDSSRDRDDKFTFVIGKKQVITGWDVGVASMRRGELAQLKCTAKYAYGDAGSPPKIPGGATLIFEVELFDFYGEDISSTKDRSVTKRIVAEGEAYTKPNDFAVMTVSIVGRVKGGDEFQRYQSVVLTHGDEPDLNLPLGVELALGTMKKKEKAKIEVGPSAGFGVKGNEALGVPPNSTLLYELHLEKFDKGKESWEMEDDEKLEFAKQRKEKATDLILKGAFERATKLLEKIPDLGVTNPADPDMSDDGDDNNSSFEDNSTRSEEAKVLSQSIHLNLSLCYLRTGEYTKATQECTRVLMNDPDNEKAHYRRGEAFFKMHEYGDAKDAYETVLKISPENKSAKNKVLDCDKKIKEEKMNEKSMYQNMFKPFSS